MRWVRLHKKYGKCSGAISGMLLLFAVSCFNSGSGPGSDVPDTDLSPGVKSVVTDLEVTGTGADKDLLEEELWKLFDGDAETYPATGAGCEIKLKLASSGNVKGISVFGKGKGIVLSSESGEKLYGFAEGSPGKWRHVTLANTYKDDVFTLYCPAFTGTDDTPGEIGIWTESAGEVESGRACTSISGVRETETLLKALKGTHTGSIEIGEHSLLSGTSGRSDTVTFTFQLGVNPGLIRHAYLCYEGYNLEETLILTKQINDGAEYGGFDIPSASDTSPEWKSFCEEINPGILKRGGNSIKISSKSSVELRDLKLCYERDSGWNAVETCNESAAVDGDIATGAILKAGGEELSVSFAETVSTLSVMIYVKAKAAFTGKIEYLSSGTWVTVEGAVLDSSSLVTGWNRIDLPEGIETGSLRLKADSSQGSGITIAELRVATAGVYKKPEIVVSSPRSGEYFGRTAYFYGFLRNTGRAVSCSVEGKTLELNEADRSFSAALSKDECTRFASQADDVQWTPVITGTGSGTDENLSCEVALYNNRLFEGNDTSSSSGSEGDGDSSSGDTGDGTWYSDGTYHTTVYPETSKTITVHDMTIEIPAGAVESETEIIIKPLTEDEVPELDAGMTNTTYPAAGYRILPHQVFRKDISIQFNYDETRVPSGQKTDDIYTYFYNETEKQWERIERVEIDKSSKVVISRVAHFTDFINATLTVPEHPDPLSYNPTSIKDLKIGNPAEGISRIEAPGPTSRGDAEITYALEIPRGRAGVQPSVTLRYSSGGGNGWAGTGWDVSVSSISIDTRLGVPHQDTSGNYYTTGVRAPRYVLDGQQLVYDSSTGAYHPRREGSFKRIERLGTSPTDYYWRVTEKNGTQYIYGRDTDGRNYNSKLVNYRNSNIFTWYLEKVIDTNGNTVLYYYQADDAAPSDREQWTARYLHRIRYTGFNGSDGPYEIEFVINNESGDEEREDIVSSCRGGFQALTRYRLKQVLVKFEDTVFRSYGFEYEQGAFGKSLLSALVQYDVKGTEFYRHEFEYYNEVASGSNIDGFTGDRTWSGVHAPDFTLPLDDSAIGGGEGKGAGVDAYLGFSPFSWFKSRSGGVKVGRNYSWNENSHTLMDVNGDGITDQVYASGSSIKYKPGGQSGFGGSVSMSGLSSNIGKDNSNSITVGPELYTGAFQFSASKNWGEATTSKYFSDVNGDGLVDFVSGGNVKFNSLSSDGTPTFSSISPVYSGVSTIGDGVVDLTGVSVADTDTENARPSKSELAEDFYRDDAVRIWKAPFRGMVRITGDVTLLSKPDTEEANEYTTEDGVRVSIETGGYYRWMQEIPAGQSDPVTPYNVNDIWVEAGDEIYFRVDSVDDGSYDVVQWDPVVEYLMEDTAQRDENGFCPYIYQASEDFSLAGYSNSWYAPVYDGTANLAGSVVKTAATSDEIELVIIKIPYADQDTEEEIYSVTIGATWTGEIPVDLTGIDLLEGDQIQCRLKSDTPLDWRTVSWHPLLTFTSARIMEDGATEPTTLSAQDSSGNYVLVYDLPVNYQVYRDKDSEAAVAYVADRTGAARFIFKVQCDDPSSLPSDFDANVSLAVKKDGRLIKKKNARFLPYGISELVLEAEVDVTEGEEFFFICSSDTESFESYLTVGVPQVEYEVAPLVYTTAEDASQPRVYVIPEDEGNLRGGFRNWYYGRWCGETSSSTGQRINPALMEVTISDDLMTRLQGGGEVSLSEEEQNDLLEQYKTYSPMSTDNCYYYDSTEQKWKRFERVQDPGASVPELSDMWVGNDPDTWIGPAAMSATRLGRKYLNEDDEIPFKISADTSSSSYTPGTARAVNKFTKTKSWGFGGGTGFASGNWSKQDTKCYIDYFDFNGDRLPDIVASGSVQFTLPDGTMSSSKISPGFDLVRKSQSENLNVGGGRDLSIIDTSGDEKRKTQVQLKPSLGLNSIPGFGASTTKQDFIDMNGDGLPDLVKTSADTFGSGTVTVRLNLGYGLGTEQEWASGVKFKVSKTVIFQGPGLGFGSPTGTGYYIDSYFYGGGLNTSLSITAVEADFIDMNGDGLPDLVQKDLDILDLNLDLSNLYNTGTTLQVRFNTGRGFGPVRYWNNMDQRPIMYNESFVSTAAAYGGFPIPIIIPIGFVPVFIGSIIVNPGGYANYNNGQVKAQMRDMDGDGLTDRVYTDTSGNFRVRLNKTGKTNLLKTVKRPMGGILELTYERRGNTQDMPQSRWVLTKTRVTDGMADLESAGEHENITAYDYEEGYYDRGEREFYGFKKVITKEGVEDEAYERKSISYYKNSDYYETGLLYKTEIYDSSENLYVRSDMEYGQEEIATDAEFTRYGSRFTYLKKKTSYFFEGGTTSGTYTAESYRYDSYGNVTGYTDEAHPGSEDNVTAEITYNYDTENYLMAMPVQIIVTGGDGEEYRKRRGVYDGKGRLRLVQTITGDSATIDTYLDYNEHGMLAAVTTPPNHRGQKYRVLYTYDSRTGTQIVKTTDSFGYESSAQYDYRYGKPIYTVDINNNPMTYSYDNQGRLALVYAPNDIGSCLPTVSAYYTGAQTQGEENRITSPASALVRNKPIPDQVSFITTLTFADGNGRTVQSAKSAEVSTGSDSRYGMTVSGLVIYDTMGRIKEQGQGEFVQGGISAYRTKGSAKNPVRNEYDAMGRKTLVTHPDGAQEKTAYGFEEGKFLIRHEDPLGSVTRTLRDVRGQIQRIVKEAESGDITTRYYYNPIGEMIRVADHNYNATDVTYDKAGRRTSILSPDAGYMSWEYDSAGNIIRHTKPVQRAAGKTIKYAYEYNRLIRVDYPDMADVNYTYGEAGSPYNRAGRVETVENGTVTETSYYGRLGELVRQDRTIQQTQPETEEKTFTTRYKYDNLGRMKHMIYPDGETLFYIYDRGGLLRRAYSVAASGNVTGTDTGTYEYVKEILYDEFGARVKVTYGNGMETGYAYDEKTRRLTNLRTVDSSARAMQNISYTYDLAGNITARINDGFYTVKEDETKRSEQTYTYDKLHRLTGSTGTYTKVTTLSYFGEHVNKYTTKYEYDVIGNITRKEQDHRAYYPDANDEDLIIPKTTYTQDYEYKAGKAHAVSATKGYRAQYTEEGGKNYYYDLNGNMTKWKDTNSGVIRTFTWDEENRLTQTADPYRTTTYKYDPAGMRAVKKGQYGEVLYVNSNYNIRNGEIESKHIFVGTTRVASKLTKDSTESLGIFYYHPDHLGSSSTITTQSGKHYENLEYFPFGSTWVHEMSSDQVELPYRYCSKEYDPETGMYYYGHRYLDVELCRWISADPALGKYFPNANDFDTEHDYFHYLSNDASGKLPGMGGVFNAQNMDLYHYAGNNPVKFTDPDGRVTWQFGVSSDAQAAVGVTGGTGWVIGFSLENGLQIGSYVTYGYGSIGDVGVSGTVEVSTSRHTDINDLAGDATTTGGTIDAGAVPAFLGIWVSPTGGIDVTVPKQGKKIPTYSLKGGLSVSASPVEGHVMHTTTKITDYKIKEIFKKYCNFTIGNDGSGNEPIRADNFFE